MDNHEKHLASVITYYDTHPINEEQILRALGDRGTGLNALSEDDLKDFDQDHYGGLQANDVLAAKAGIQAQHHVLDVCSGMGGPARYLAHRIGCRVTGIDFTESRFRSAIKLTELVGLSDKVDFVHGNALDMPFENGQFDIVIGQEAWCHVPEKSRLISECARVLKPGGVIAFTDIVRTDKLTSGDMRRLRSEMTYPELESISGYSLLLKQNGFTPVEITDLSEVWTRILEDRLAMYRSLGAETERKFGAARSQEWDEAYSFFVSRYREERLGGGRFIARRDSQARQVIEE